MLPKNRPPTAPGEILTEEFLKPMKMTQGQLAKKLGTYDTVVSGLVTGKRAISPEMAVKLAMAFDTTPELWANLQRDVDLWAARKKLASVAHR